MRKPSFLRVRPLAAGALLALGLVAAPLAGAMAVEAPTPPPKPASLASDSGQPQQFGSWVITCPGAQAKANCVLMQQLTETLSRNVVFVWLLQYDNAGNLMSVFRTPSGVFIKPGLEIKMDTSKQNLRVDFERCDPGQCQAVFSIPGDLLRQLSSAKALSVAISLTSGQTVDVPLKMDGFSGAVAALAQQSRHD
jgi:invasion protein IalB